MSKASFARFDIPTKEQIAAITDVASLEGIADEVSDHIEKLEVDLEFRIDDEWAARARNVLSLFRTCRRQLLRQIARLQTKRARVREEHETSDLAWELIEEVDGYFVDTLTTAAEIESARDWLVERIDALKTDRDEELAKFPPGERDEEWLVIANATLRRAGDKRQRTQDRYGVVRKAETFARAHTAERAFIELAKERMPADEFQAMWDEIYVRHPSLRRSA